MSTPDAEPVGTPDSEATSAGEQLLVPGVKPVTVREWLDRLASLPLAPTKPQSLSTSGSSTRLHATN
jgi:hypothetical protein